MQYSCCQRLNQMTLTGQFLECEMPLYYGLYSGCKLFFPAFGMIIPKNENVTNDRKTESDRLDATCFM